MGDSSWCFTKMLPIAAMIGVECMDVGLTTLSKAAMSKGDMSHFVFVVYSNALATLILFPLSLFIHWGKRPPLTLSLLGKFFLLSLIGITLMQNCVFTGINYSSPTLASAMSSLIPAFTFLLALIFRMEKVDLKSRSSQIKISGTIVSILGALVVTFYKGPPVGSLPIQSSTILSNGSSHFQSPTFLPIDFSHTIKFHSKSLATESNWVLGGLFFAAATLSVSIWNTSQAAILNGYPSELTIVAFYCLFGTIQCTAVTLIAEANNPRAWKIKPDIELISVIYSAVFGGVVTFSAQTWCIHKKGPVFVAMFKPIGIAIAALLGVIFLGDTLYAGSVIGAMVIVVGFYGVIWSQSKEQALDKLPSSSEKAPLLHTRLGTQNL